MVEILVELRLVSSEISDIESETRRADAISARELIRRVEHDSSCRVGLVRSLSGSGGAQWLQSVVSSFESTQRMDVGDATSEVPEDVLCRAAREMARTSLTQRQIERLFSTRLITETLLIEGGNMSRAAERRGLARQTLYYRLRSTSE